MVKFGPKPPNKDDLKRVYVASKTGTDGRVYLALAWVRIPQNTTNASAHVAFEFNQNEGGCPNTTIPGNDGLSFRSTANGGDMLIVYDFAGSSTDTPSIKLLRWIGSTSGFSCEVGSTFPCWGNAKILTDLGFAEGKVNTSDVGPVTDEIAPSPPETLGNNEFGEAIIDLTGAGVFPANPTSCLSFGRVFGVSRSSGNSAQAQMKDLVGPGDVSISNCGQVIIRKVTDPAGDTVTDFGYTTDVATLPATTTSPFSLKDGENNTIVNVALGSYFVTEDNPSGDGYALTDIDCSASTTATAPTEDEANRTASFTIAADETVDCTFTNTLQQGGLRILKQSTKSGTPLVSSAGAVFAVDGPDEGTAADFSVTDDETAAAPDEDADIGEVCVSGLAPGVYTVNETSPPSGYGGASQSDVSVTVVSGTNCTDNLPTGSGVATFTNAPLSDIQVRFRDAGSGETTAVIECDNLTGTSSTEDTTGWDDTLTVEDIEAPTLITCTIDIDP